MRRREHLRHPWPPQAWPGVVAAKVRPAGRWLALQASLAAAPLRRRGGSTKRRPEPRCGAARGAACGRCVQPVAAVSDHRCPFHRTRRGLRPLRARGARGRHMPLQGSPNRNAAHTSASRKPKQARRDAPARQTAPRRLGPAWSQPRCDQPGDGSPSRRAWPQLRCGGAAARRSVDPSRVGARHAARPAAAACNL